MNLLKALKLTPPCLTQDSFATPWVSDAVRGLLLQLVCHREAPPQCHATHVHTGRAQQPLLLPTGTLITGLLAWREVPTVPRFLVPLQSQLVSAEWASEDRGGLRLQYCPWHLHCIQTPPGVRQTHQPLRLAGSEFSWCLTFWTSVILTREVLSAEEDQ